MNTKLIGRVEEKALLEKALKSNQSEMIALVGRRRVGKTFLINKVYKEFDFECTGKLNATLSEQLENFFNKIEEYYPNKKKLTKPSNWLQAFILLKELLKSKHTKRKKVIFIDELPWMETPKSKFVDALGHFWNDYAVKNNIVVVLCGSAASWMIKKIVRNKGSLHNRITQLIQLRPFTLKETELYLHSKHIKLERNQITQLYMVMGGIPFYLSAIQPEYSIAKNIDTICFKTNGLLHKEFDFLFASLFHNAAIHIAIIQALASKWKGITRKEILRITKYTDGGTITTTLEELENASFISTTAPFGKKKKETLYRICDPFILFNVHFIAKHTKQSKNTFQLLVQSAKWYNWCGYAFENICLLHIDQLLTAMGIANVYCEISSWVKQGTTLTNGTQIDLLIDRADNVINICEIKFTENVFIVTKDYAKKLEQKRQVFKNESNTIKAVLLCLVSNNGVKANAYAHNALQQSIVLDNLFD